MEFHLEYEGGYVVTLTQVWEDNSLREKPLRKFKKQGDALIFKEEDCPHLSELQIKHLVGHYDPNILFDRIDERHFRRSNCTITQY